MTSATTICVHCTVCHEDANLEPVQVVLHPCSNKPELSFYRFTCPAASCGAGVEKPADAHVIALLHQGNVRIQAWSVPAEAMEQHNGPALTSDDLIDFALAIEKTGDLPDELLPA